MGKEFSKEAREEEGSKFAYAPCKLASFDGREEDSSQANFLPGYEREIKDNVLTSQSQSQSHSKYSKSIISITTYLMMDTYIYIYILL